ncbi:MAG: S-layer homology domain-containing protein [Oscillospiraceae bacterium]|nr:S-layer homology domain-containing protein [Oscillospiraceae bacterium]
MKKRLLSAALALAMVLTMLPLTAFAYTYDSPEPKGDGTETVAYLEYGNANHLYSKQGASDNTFPGPGWYVTINVPADNTDPSNKKPAKTVYYQVPDGVSVGGKYYTVANAANTATATDSKNNKTIYNWSFPTDGSAAYKTGLKGAVIVIGGTITIDAVNASSLTVDICGGTVTITQTPTGTNASAANPTKLTSLTINNSLYAKTKAKGNLTMTSLDKLTNLTLNYVKVTDAISLTSKVVSNNAAQNNGGQAHTLTLKGAEVGAITLDGKGTNSPTATHAAQRLDVTSSSVGDITVNGVNNTVTLNEVKATNAPNVTIEGTGGSLNVRGGSVLGAVTVKSGADKETTAAPSSITVETGSTVGNISSAQSGDLATGRNTITIGGTSGAITAKNSTVNVNGGHTGKITLTTGAVSVSGNRASVGDVELAHDATFNLTGTNCTVGALAVDSTDGTPATVTFNVPNDPSNTLGSTSDAITNYTKKTVKGGTWKHEVDAANLDASLAYQLKKGATGSTYTYYTSDQLGEAILEQGTNTGSKLTKIGDSSATNTVTFMNGSMTWGVLTISPNMVIPKLPTQMNNIKTPYWSDGEFSNLTGSYSVPNKPGGTTLNAGGGMVSTDVTKLTEVKVGANTSSIKAALAGSTIVLSGAVESGNTMFELTLETDAVENDSSGGSNKEVSVVIELSVIFDPSTKSLTIANPGSQSLGHGVVIENGFQAIKLSNGSRYTFDGKGLVVRTTDIKVKELEKGYPADTAYGTGIEVIVSAPGYTATQALKDQVIDLINAADATVNWKDSPAVKRAVNAALATITDKTVEGYINAASARARSDHRLASNKDTAYQDGPSVWLVPYLEVNVTNYLPNPINPSLTANLTLKWRVEVHPKESSTYPKVKEAANVANAKGTFIAKQGTALTLDEDLVGTTTGAKGIEIEFKNGLTAATYAHQADTYDYARDTTGKFTVTHAVNGNLGKFVLDTVKPLIRVGDKTNDNQIDIGTGKIVTYFSTLQAAVDAAEDGKMIEIDSNYKGSTTINMTGKARTIYIQANGKNVVVANASGGMVENNEKGSFYTIKLNRDNTVTANAVVSVGSASNGSASVDTTIAKPGSSVSGKYTANSGYKAGSFTATAQPGNKSVSVSVSANGTFSFTVPSGATSVTVTPSFVLDNGLPFTDVANNAWYFTAVKYCYDTTNNGYRLMEGDSAATFAPNGSFTRAHMVQILWNMKGRPTPKTTANPFRDMSSSNWYYSAVLWAYENGYAKGYPDGTFKPGQAVTRQEMVQFLYQASGSRSGSGNLSYYSDGYTANNWAQPALRWATGLGILSGQNSASLGNTLAPRAVAKRCEVAVTVMNFDKLNLF